MRKRSKSKILLDKADRCVQDWFRKHYPKQKCESCGIRTFYCVHHFIEKSKSNNLRYNLLNLIFICRHCHSLHHSFGDATIHAKIQNKKGNEWWQKLQKEYKKKRASFTIKELNDIIRMYEIK